MIKRRISDFRLIYSSSNFCLNITNYAIVFTVTSFHPLMACTVNKTFTSLLPVITKWNYSKITMTEESRFKGAICQNICQNRERTLRATKVKKDKIIFYELPLNQEILIKVVELHEKKIKHR